MIVVTRRYSPPPMCIMLERYLLWINCSYQEDLPGVNLEYVINKNDVKIIGIPVIKTNTRDYIAGSINY